MCLYLIDVLSSLIRQAPMRRPISINTSLSTLLPHAFILKPLCEHVWGAMDVAKRPSTPALEACTIHSGGLHTGHADNPGSEGWMTHGGDL